MHPLVFLAFAAASIFASALELDLPQQLSNFSSIIPSRTNATTLGALPRVECFGQRPTDEPIAKHDCEEALDSFVGEKDLTTRHTFAYDGRRTDSLPLEQTFGTCAIQFRLANQNDRVSITLGEIYAQVLGPSGVIKSCLGTSEDPPADAVGGRMYIGREGKLIVTIENPFSPRFSAVERRTGRRKIKRGLRRTLD